MEKTGSFKIKKIFLVMALAIGILGLSVTASHALQPGINPALFQMQKNAADAVRLKERAYSKQLTKQNDSVLAISCFGLSLRLTGSLGILFSDRVPANFSLPSLSYTLPRLTASLTCSPAGITPVINITPFALNLSRGALDLLTRDLGSVISGVLGQMLNNFLGTMVGALGGLISGWVLDNFSAAIAFLPSLPSNLPFPFSIFAGGIPCLPGCPSGDPIRCLLESLMGMLFPQCQFFAQLWTGNGANSAVGSGLEGLLPYIDMAEFILNTATLGGMAPDFMQEVTAPAASALVLARAATSYTGLPTNLVAPCLTSDAGCSWMRPKTYAPNVPTSTIISGMDTP